jgi:hypothetical protein
MIPQTILDKFKALYLSDYNIALTDAQALEKCTALFTALSVITQPLTSIPKGANNE